MGHEIGHEMGDTDMPRLTRREFVKAMGAAAASGLAGLPLSSRAGSNGRVVVVGGGYAGATVAKYLRLADPTIQVTLVERNPEFISCALSNEVLSGVRTMESLTFDYQALANNRGVRVVHDEAIAIDPVKHTVETKDGQILDYDRLIVAPGISLRWGAIEGYDRAAAEVMPHAWKAGAQTLLLKRQLREMKDGGTVMMVAPPNPFRCPPGPYERAAQIAYYLSQRKPKSKIIIFDAKDRFSKQALFQQGWEEHYPGMITWIPASEDGKVFRVDPKKRMLFTEFDEHTGDVVNVIPPQQAGTIAHPAGLTDESGWCPVDQRTFESTIHRDIHVIGDASIAGAMPKSGYAANSQGKVCAAAVAALLNENPPPEASFVNTCYSLISPDHGISVAAVYRVVDGKITSVKGAGGVSPKDASEWEHRMEADYARSWFTNITSDIFT
jgi:sulfide dehydrogenase [flavocytochrome c] flavoprotein subunit